MAKINIFTTVIQYYFCEKLECSLTLQRRIRIVLELFGTVHGFQMGKMEISALRSVCVAYNANISENCSFMELFNLLFL